MGAHGWAEISSTDTPTACRRSRGPSSKALPVAATGSRKGDPRPVRDAAATAYTDFQVMYGAVVAVDSRCLSKEQNDCSNVVAHGQRLQSGLSGSSPAQTLCQCLSGLVLLRNTSLAPTGSATSGRVQSFWAVQWHAREDEYRFWLLCSHVSQ